MAKKLQKPRKGMSPKAKFTLVHAFKGIISNQSCVEGSYNSPWWVAAIFFVLAVLIPLLPNFFRLGSVNGGSYLTSATYGLDKQMTAVAYQMKGDGVDLVVKHNLLHYELDGVIDDSQFVTPDDTYFEEPHQEYSYVNTTTNQYELRVFLWDLKGNKLQKAINKVATQYFKKGTQQFITEKDDPKYVPNLVFFTKQTMAVALYKFSTKTQVVTTPGGLTWNNTGKKGLVTRILSKSIKDGVWAGGTPSLTVDEFVNTYSTNTYKALVAISNEAYLHQRTITKWQTTGIYAGIYAGVIVFLGLMLLLLTRGKNNPFKHLNIWDCQKIAWWASFTPGLLGMILSLVLTTNSIGQISFVMFVSVRLMWLSMKQLRPVYNQQ